MELRTCKKCGKIFQYITGAPICSRCKKAEEELFQVIKEYLRANKGASMEEVCEVTGASVKMIERYLREGRLEVTSDSPIALNCEQCGTKIRTGRLCDRCRARLNNGLSKAAQSIRDSNPVRRERTKERMRFLDSYNNNDNK